MVTQIERYKMFSDWKNQCCQNDCTIRGNLWIPRSPYQLTSQQHFSENQSKKKFKAAWKQKIPNGQSNPEKKKKQTKEQSSSLTSNYTTKLQSSKQYGTATKTDAKINETAQKAQNKPTQLWSINV